MTEQLPTKSITVVEFLQNHLTTALAKLASDSETRFFSFGLVTFGIELLGSFKNDDHSLFCKDAGSKERFKRGLDYMKQTNNRYKCNEINQNTYGLYEGVRCGCAHLLMPQHSFAFTSKPEAINAGWKHLQRQGNSSSGQLVVVAEDFAEDFCNAVDEFIKDSNSFTGEAKRKAEAEVLVFHGILSEGKPSVLSATNTEASITICTKCDVNMFPSHTPSSPATN